MHQLGWGASTYTLHSLLRSGMCCRRFLVLAAACACTFGLHMISHLVLVSGVCLAYRCSRCDVSPHNISCAGREALQQGLCAEACAEVRELPHAFRLTKSGRIAPDDLASTTSRATKSQYCSMRCFASLYPAQKWFQRQMIHGFAYVFSLILLCTLVARRVAGSHVITVRSHSLR